MSTPQGSKVEFEATTEVFCVARANCTWLINSAVALALHLTFIISILWETLSCLWFLAIPTYFCTVGIQMQEISTPLLRRISDTANAAVDFLPPMSTSNSQNHQIPDPDSLGADKVVPLKKRRQISLESGVTLGVAIVEPTVGSSESSPTMMSTSSSASPSPETAKDCNDRTSKDYYFDSYAHHAIRTFV